MDDQKKRGKMLDQFRELNQSHRKVALKKFKMMADKFQLLRLLIQYIGTFVEVHSELRHFREGTSYKVLLNLKRPINEGEINF